LRRFSIADRQQECVFALKSPLFAFDGMNYRLKRTGGLMGKTERLFALLIILCSLNGQKRF
jgi:hypothetical protein